MTPTTTRPSILRLIALGAIAITTFGLLAAIPLDAAPTAPADVLQWWDEVGTAAATMVILRAIAQLAALWLSTISMLGVIVSLAALGSRSGLSSLLNLWSLLAPRSLRRIVATSLVLSVATPSIATADEPPTPLPVLVDVGAADHDAPNGDRAPAHDIADVPSLVDLGPIVTQGLTQPAPGGSPAAPEVERWQVQRGDHLWKIAAETLADRGAGTTDAEVARYWRRLIDTNRDEVGTNPDLIHVGMILTLPAE